MALPDPLIPQCEQTRPSAFNRQTRQAHNVTISHICGCGLYKGSLVCNPNTKSIALLPWKTLGDSDGLAASTPPCMYVIVSPHVSSTAAGLLTQCVCMYICATMRACYTRVCNYCVVPTLNEHMCLVHVIVSRPTQHAYINRSCYPTQCAYVPMHVLVLRQIHDAHKYHACVSVVLTHNAHMHPCMC